MYGWMTGRMQEAFEQAERRAARADTRLQRRPICPDCGRRIGGSWCFPLENGEYLCEKCMYDRMMDTADLEEETG